MYKFIKSLISISLCAFLLTPSYAREKLIVWEELGKSSGIKNAVKAFKKKCNCQIEVRELSCLKQYSSLYDAVRDENIEIPDVLVFPADQIGKIVDEGLISELPFMESDASRYLKTVNSMFRVQGRYYAVPRSVETMVLYYNKDLISYPYETFEEYENFSDVNKENEVYGLLGRFDQFYYTYGFMSAYGGYIFGTDANGQINPEDIGLNNEGAVAGLSLIAKYSRNYLPSWVFSDDGFNFIDDKFIAGQAAAVISGPWSLEKYARAGVNFGVAPMPKLQNGAYLRPFLTAKGYCVAERSPNKRLAMEFVEFINSYKYIQERYKYSGELPPVKEFLGSIDLTHDDFANAIVLQLFRSDVIPSVVQMDNVWRAMNESIYKAIHEETTVENALNEAVDRINANQMIEVQ